MVKTKMVTIMVRLSITVKPRRWVIWRSFFADVLPALVAYQRCIFLWSYRRELGLLITSTNWNSRFRLAYLERHVSRGTALPQSPVVFIVEKATGRHADQYGR